MYEVGRGDIEDSSERYMGGICCGVSGYLPSCRIAVYRREYDEEGGG